MQKIIPAILTQDIKEMRSKLELISSFSEWVQIDIMDGDFVEDTSLTLYDVNSLGINFNFEIHLMVECPADYFDDCQALGARRVIVHYEAIDDMGVFLGIARNYSFDLFIALNPDTEADTLAQYIHMINGVMLLTVFPGMSGQKFISEVLYKVPQLRKMRKDIVIGVDGGANKESLPMICKAGVDYAGVNSGLFKSKDIIVRYNELIALMSC